MENSKFSVVIPAFNREKTIGRTITSVLNQTWQNWECIVVDDGSTDNTGDVVNSFSIKDSRIRCIKQKNGGACSARNRGGIEADGDFLLFLDSDDEILPDFMKKTVSVFDENNNLGAVYCLTGIYRNGLLEAARNDTLQGENIYSQALQQGYITSSSFIAIRRKCFGPEHVMWDESLPASQDDDFCFQIAKVYPVALIPEILGVYNTDAVNNIMASKKRVADGWWLLWNKYEADVISFCGRDCLASHYYEVAQCYVNAHHKAGINMAMKKVKENLPDELFLKYKKAIKWLAFRRRVAESYPARFIRNLIAKVN